MPIPPLINWVHIATDPSQQLPESYVHWMRTCAKTNTDLTLLFWSAADCAALVAARYPSFSSFYHSELKTSIYKADFCRMLVLHAVGGIYLDLDFYCIRPLSPLLSHSLFVAEEPIEHKRRWRNTIPRGSLFISNAVIGSEPNHSFWPRQLDFFAGACRHKFKTNRPCKTGPHVFSGGWTHARMREPRGSVLPTSTFFPVTSKVERKRRFDEPRTYGPPTLAAHMWGSSYTKIGQDAAAKLSSSRASSHLPPRVERPLVQGASIARCRVPGYNDMHSSLNADAVALLDSARCVSLVIQTS